MGTIFPAFGAGYKQRCCVRVWCYAGNRRKSLAREASQQLLASRALDGLWCTSRFLFFFALLCLFIFTAFIFFSPFSTDTRDLSNFCDVRKRHFVVTHRMVPSAGSAHVRILMFSFAAISCPYEIASQASSGREHCSPSSLLVCVDYVADGTAPRCRVKNASFTRSEQRVRH